MKKLLILSLSIIGLFASCGKDKTTTTTPTETTAQKIQHKWNFISGNDYFNHGTGTVDSTHYWIGAPGDYVEFKNNGFAYRKDGVYLDTITYSILSDTKMTFDYDTFTITTLNANNLVFTYYETVTPPFFVQENVFTR